MSYNGSGTFVINTAGQPVVANTVISATVFNALTADLATGLSTAITKDGQTTITANIPFGSNKITGLGSGTAATDAANLGQVQSTAAKLVTVTGTDTLTGTMSPALTAYATGQLFYFIAGAANTGAMTINIDGLGAKSITRDGSTALIANDVLSGEIVVICYDGTRFQMINAANSFGNTTINGTLTVTGNAGFQANVSITSALSVGGVFAVTGASTLTGTATLTANPVLNGGTANGVLYLNGSKVATSGSALTFDGSGLGINMVASEGGVTPALFAKQNSNGAFEGLVVRSSAAGGEILAISYDGSVFNHTASYVGSGGYVPLAWTVSGSEAMRLTSTGLGIGTSSPVGKLDVVGSSSRVRWDLSNAYVYQAATNTAGSAFAAAYYDGSQHLWLTSSSTRMTLDASGNLGLGVTPSAWGSGKAIEVGSVGNSFWGTGATSNYLLQNAYHSGGAFRYASNNPASGYGQNSSNHYWYTAASGTAGNAISFTQAMTLDADGDLGIGTTSPASKLHVKVGTNKNLEVRDASAWDGSYSGVFLDSLNDARTSVVDLVARGSNLTLASAGATPMIFNTNATERARITSAGELLVGKTSATSNGGVVQVSNGITFPATQSACSDANTLDDYEEGTWTPSLGGTATYTIQSGTYTKIGRQVTVSCRIQVNAIGTGTTTTFTGLPFTSANADYFGTAYWHTSATALVYLAGGISSTTVTLYGATAATGTLASQVVFQNSTIFVFTATYFV